VGVLPIKSSLMGATDDEQAWVMQSRNGDPEAFEALVRTYQRMIHSLTYRMTGSMSDAEDLAQETFLRAYQGLANYHGDAKFSSWLYRIAINVCLNWRQREARRTRLLQQVEAQEKPQGTPGEGEMDGADLRGQVQQLLMKLPAKQRAALVITVYDGLNHSEAGRILGCSETTVSWRIFAARRKLKRWLGPAGRAAPGR
jgi:RNA polymerase sigma-70 factor (ECF subfamily)